MTEITDLIRRTSATLIKEHEVDAGLEMVAHEIEAEAQAPADGAAKRLRRRVRAVHAAAEDLRRLIDQVEYLAGLVRFTEEGWPPRRNELEERLGSRPIDGLADWLADWFMAASEVRLEALDRLTTLALPPEGALLADRARAARLGLSRRSWSLAQPMLAAGMAGVGVGDRTVPGADVRQALRLILVRLAIAEGLDEQVEALLRAAEKEHPSLVLDALRARWRRLRRGESEDAPPAAALEGASGLDAAVELIERARAEGRGGQEVARIAVDALPVLGDARAQIDQLLCDVPPEIWLAVAERALREASFDVYDEAIGNAWNLIKVLPDHALRASFAEIRATAAKERSQPESDRVSALIEAGTERLWANQPELGVPHFREAIRIDGGNVEAMLGLAAGLLTGAWSQPLTRARANLTEALTLIQHAQTEGLVTPELTWSYSTESYIRQNLLRSVELDTDGHGWLGFLAAVRSVASAPGASDRWLVLAGAAEAIELRAVAVAAAGQARTLSSDWHSQAYAEKLANAGRYEEALNILEESDCALVLAVRAYLLLRLNDPVEALRLLRLTDIDPNWGWAGESLVFALALTGRFDEAVREAEALASRWADRTDEVNAIITAGWAALIRGQFKEARDFALRVKGRTQEATVLGAAARLLMGSKGARKTLANALGGTTVRHILRDWPVLISPLLRVIAARNEFSLPSLDELDAIAERRLNEMPADPDPVEELQKSRPDSRADPAAVDLARAMGSALVEIARDRPGAALAALVVPGELSDDPHVQALRTLARERKQNTTIEREVDTEVTPGLPASDPTAGAEPEPDFRLQLELPTSWFHGHGSPTRSHPLFLRYLPEARARMDGKLPSVKVRPSDELEPDGYIVSLSGVPVERRRVDAASLYAPAAAVPLLGATQLERVPFDETLCRLPAEATPDPLAGLLTMTAVEVLVRRLEALARARPEIFLVELMAANAKAGDVEAAEDQLRQVIDLVLAAPPEDRVTTLQLSGVGDALANAAERDASVPLVRRAMAMFDAAFSADEDVHRVALEFVVKAFMTAGDANFIRGAVEQAAVRYREGLPLALLTAGNCLDAQFHVRLGLLAASRADHAAVDEHFRSALEGASAPVDAQFHIRLGLLAASRIDHATVDQQFRSALACLREEGASAPVWDVVAECSALCGTIGRVPAAEQSLSKLINEAIEGGTVPEFRGKLTAAAPGDWIAKESTTLLAPDGQANVIASSEPLDPSIDSERYASIHGDHLRSEFPEYDEKSLEQVEIFGGRSGWMRHFEWKPSDGEPVMQLQLYYVENGRGYTATATTPAERFPAREFQLRQILLGLRIID